MKVFKPSNNTHEFRFIQRDYIPLEVDIYLKDEFDGTEITFSSLTNVVGGYVYVDFDFEFIESDKGEIKIMDNDNVIYRGVYFSTEQDPQGYELTEDTYTFADE